jgi:DNA-binding beta-propeller fold protein YncE
VPQDPPDLFVIFVDDFERRTDTVRPSCAVGQFDPAPVEPVSPDGRRLYAANYGSSTVSMIDINIG